MLAIPILFGFCAAAQPQGQSPAQDPRPRVAWQRNLDDALAVQKATGLPLLIAVNMDGEVFNERFAGDTYHDPVFVELTRGYVCVVASPDRHTERDYDAAGKRIECPRFGGCTCSEHIQIEPELFRRWFDGKRNAPRHVGVSKDGKVLFDRYLDASMQTAIDAVRQHRGQPPANLGATDDAAALFARRDALARELLERRYRRAEPSERKQLLLAAATATNEPIDLLRMALHEEDQELIGLGAMALSRTANAAAYIDIEDALARISDDGIRQALLSRLRELGKDIPEAARLADNLAAAAAAPATLPAPWCNPWRDDSIGTDRAAIEAALDAAEAATRKSPDDDAARLALAVAQAAFAGQLARENGSGVELWYADAERNAGKVRATGLAAEAQAVLAIARWQTGDTDGAAKAAEAAAAKKSDRSPGVWLARTFLSVRLQLTAQQAYAKLEQEPGASTREVVRATNAMLDALQSHGTDDERGPLTGIGLLEFAGLRAEAQERLRWLVERFPASTTVHERWRNRLLVDLGAEGMRHAYANYAAKAADRATADWFAGYAALVAGDRNTTDGRWIEAESAYGDAAERFAASAAANPGYADSSNHFAVFALAGRAVVRQHRGNDKGAVADLVKAADLRPQSLDETDGLQRKPRAVADRLARELRAAGKEALADQLGSLQR